MRILTKILLVLVIILGAIQFIRPTRNTSSEVFATDIINSVQVPPDVLNILKTSCYDCHSNNTCYPWYTHIQPIGWFVAYDIEKGKADLNFNEFKTYSKRQQANKLRAIELSIKENTMPMKEYVTMHRDAKLSKETRDRLLEWIKVETKKSREMIPL